MQNQRAIKKLTTQLSYQRELDSLKALARHRSLLIGCDATAEGILSATGLCYLAHLDPNNVRFAPKEAMQARLDETTVVLTTYPALAARVLRALQKLLRNRAYTIAYIGASCDPTMPESLHRFIRATFSLKERVFNELSNPYLAHAFELERSVRNECERARQFVRFKEMKNGIFFAVHKPKDRVIPLTLHYFRQRLPHDAFVLLDEVHGDCVLSEPRHYDVITLDKKQRTQLKEAAVQASDELYVERMWKAFYDALEIENRRAPERGYDLRTQNMPQRFWDNLCELSEQNSTHNLVHIPARYAE